MSTSHGDAPEPRERVAAALRVQPMTRFEQADRVLAALGLDDLDAFSERVAAALPIPQPPAFPKTRTAQVRRAIESALRS